MRESAAEPESPAGSGRAFALFAFLWAFAGLLDLSGSDLSGEPAWQRSVWHGLLGGSCIFVLLRPASRVGFGAMALLRIAAFSVDSPFTANHRVLYAIASATVLAAAVGVLRRRRSLDAGSWLEAFAPWLRVQILLLYFFAVLHKLNVDYLDPQVSCAVELFARAAPGWLEGALTSTLVMRRLLVFGSLAAETAIPLLLLFPRTRWLGLAGGVLFHGFLGLQFYAFSTGVFAFYSLFVPPAVTERLGEAWERWRSARGAVGAIVSPAGAGALCILFAVALDRGSVLLRNPGPWREATAAAGPWLFGAWAVGFVATAGAFLLSRAARGHWSGATSGRLRASLLFVFPLLVFVNGMAPYLGLRHAPAFSMFSNLRAEGDTTNHLFVPGGALRVASYTGDLVVVLDSNDPHLQRFARIGPRRTFHQLKVQVQRRAKAGKTDITLHYRRGGREVRLANAERDPELMAEVTWLERKLLRFRTLPAGEARRTCTW